MAPAPRKPAFPVKAPLAADISTSALDAVIAAPPVLESAMPASSLAAVEETAQEVVDATKLGAGELQEMLRKSAERGLEQTKTAYERVKAVAEEATGAIETTYARTTEGLTEISAKAVDALKANADAQFDFVKALLGAKNASEAFALQSAFARQQFDAMKDQFTELSNVAQRLAKETSEPIKASLGKTLNLAA